MPTLPSERRKLEQERAELPGQISAYRAATPAAPPSPPAGSSPLGPAPHGAALGDADIRRAVHATDVALADFLGGGVPPGGCPSR